MTEHMLTTVDNPFDPFTQNDEWTAWDEAHGYYTNSYLARIVRFSFDLSDADQQAEEERAIDEIVNENTSGLYRKVARDTTITT
jgi:hypothetical protein